MQGTDWERTYDAVEDISTKNPDYFQPESQLSHYGEFAGRHIIGRDTPINKGVYIGQGREAIVIDDHSEGYKELYAEVYKSLIEKNFPS